LLADGPPSALEPLRIFHPFDHARWNVNGHTKILVLTGLIRFRAHGEQENA